MFISSSGLSIACLRGVDAARLARAVADRHQCRPGVLHDRLHVGEVEVDDARLDDQVGDAADALPQHVVGHAEGLFDRGLGIDHVEQALIGDGDQRVDRLAQPGDALLGRAAATGALEVEGLGDDADGERAGRASMLGDDGRRSGAGATAHAGGDEDHVGAAHHLAQGIGALLGRALADLGTSARAQPFGQLVADADVDRSLAAHQRLGVGVDRDELDAVDTGIDHPVDGIAARSTDADDFDAGEGLAHHVVPVSVTGARRRGHRFGRRRGWRWIRRGFRNRRGHLQGRDGSL